MIIAFLSVARTENYEEELASGIRRANDFRRNCGSNVALIRIKRWTVERSGNGLTVLRLVSHPLRDSMSHAATSFPSARAHTGRAGCMSPCMRPSSAPGHAMGSEGTGDLAVFPERTADGKMFRSAPCTAACTAQSGYGDGKRFACRVFGGAFDHSDIFRNPRWQKFDEIDRLLIQVDNRSLIASGTFSPVSNGAVL